MSKVVKKTLKIQDITANRDLILHETDLYPNFVTPPYSTPNQQGIIPEDRARVNHEHCSISLRHTHARTKTHTHRHTDRHHFPLPYHTHTHCKSLRDSKGRKVLIYYTVILIGFPTLNMLFWAQQIHRGIEP